MALPDAVGDEGEGLLIAADQVAEFGGVERAIEALLSRFPAAGLLSPSFLAGAGAEALFTRRLEQLRGHGWYGELSVVGSPARRSHFYGPLYARRLARAPAKPVATVLSVGGAAWSLAAPVAPGARHVAWLGGPPRALYAHTRDYLRQNPTALRPLLRGAIPALRAHHRRLLARPHAVTSNSRYCASGLEAIAAREIGVIYPPVRTDHFTPATADGPRRGFVAAARLYRNKRVDLLVDAFRELDHELVIAGAGPALDDLRSSAPPNVTFAGHLGDEELLALYRRSEGLVSASVEEFGICLVEALACGTPVVAPRRGGSGEIVTPGTGVLLDDLTPAGIAAGVRELVAGEFDPEDCRERAERFSEERFVGAIAALVGAPERSAQIA